MAKIKKIIQFGHPTLRAQSSPVPTEYIKSSEITDLIQSLRDTLPENGIGLAAPQINQPWRIFIGDIYRRNWQEEDSALAICINPEIISTSTEMAVDWEGCLSAPGFWGQVKRPDKVSVRYINEMSQVITADLEGVGARVFQHELDHLNGVLFVDQMDDMTTLMTDEEFEKIRDEVRQ